MPEYRLSVVIPTYNRRERLARVLAALERQTTSAADFEVIVVDDGSVDGTSDWLETQRPSYRLRSLRLTNGGPARARNAGVDAARGAIVLFIDDDVEPMAELVEEHLRSHDAEPDVVVIGTLGSLADYAQPWVAWEQAKIESQYTAMTRGDWAPSFRQFWTGNASLERRHVLEAGGFDPTFLRGEDVELGVRLAKKGLKFRFNPNARGVHHAERSLASWENAHRSYGKAEVAIFENLGEKKLLALLAENWQALNPALRWFVKACIDRPLAHSAASTVLRRHLELASRVPVPLLSDKVCSLLANLLYWQASVQTLGPERAATVFAKNA